MRVAIIYKRVSTDDQADNGYSLPYQEERLKWYCSTNNIRIFQIFTEDHSAKSFDRPEWKKILDIVKKGSNKIDLILFLKWDRFSRNTGDAYGMINTLNRYGVESQAIEQPLDLSIPENKIMLAFYLASPEVENDRRSLNILTAMRRAKQEGRWVGTAPVGYKNARENNKAIVLLSQDAPLVKEAFEEVAKGIYSTDEVRKRMKKRGLKIHSPQYFQSLLRNVFYIGRIFVPAYKNDPACIVKGIHTPIIPLELFNKVQEILNGRKKVQTKIYTTRDELPLRGILICPKCSRGLTGSASRSRNGDRHFYYHCQKVYNCNSRFRADEANNTLVKIFKFFKANNEAVELYLEILRANYKQSEKDSTKVLKQYGEEIKRHELRISNAKRLMLDGELDSKEYKETKQEYTMEIENLYAKMKELDSVDEEFTKYMDFGSKLLKNLDEYYENADLAVKQKIVGSIFPEKLVYENKQYRTNKINSVAGLILLKTKKVKQRNIGNFLTISNVSSTV